MRCTDIIAERKALKKVGLYNIYLSYILCFGCLGVLIYFIVTDDYDRETQLVYLLCIVFVSIFYIFFGFLMDVIASGPAYKRIPPSEDEGIEYVELEDYLEIEELGYVEPRPVEEFF